MLDQVDCDYEQLIVQLGTLAGHLDDELPVSETTLPGNLAACSSDVSDRLGNSSEQSEIPSRSLAVNLVSYRLDTLTIQGTVRLTSAI